MTNTEIRKEHCRNCRETQEVKDAPCGNAILLKCVKCSYWIRCPECCHIMSAVNHECLRHNED